MISFFKKHNLLLVVALFLLASCDKAPQFSDVPQIRHLDTRVFHKTDENSLKRDSIVIALTYQDGDGNLGLSSGDTLEPYQDSIGPDGRRNKYRHNFFLDLYKKRNGNFEPFQFPDPNFTYNGRFPLLSPDGRPGTLEGELRYSVVIFDDGILFNPGDVIKFRNVHLADRALNESNLIETDEITLFTP